MRPREGRAAEATSAADTSTGVTSAGMIAGTQAGRFDVTITTPGGAFDVTIAAAGQATLTTETRPVAVGFERRIDAPVLVCHTTGVLPIRVSTALRRASRSRAPDEGKVA